MRTADPAAPTKVKILESAMRLMMAQGYEATSVDEIISDAGATKGSFFHFFKSKEDLAKAVLDRYAGRQCNMMDSAPFRKEKDPRVRLLGWIDCTIALFGSKDAPTSCVLGNFAQELAQTNPEFRSLCAEWLAKLSEGFAADAKAAGVKDAQGLADYYQSIAQGSLILVKVKNDHSIAVENFRHFRRYVESLVGGPVAVKGGGAR